MKAAVFLLLVIALLGSSGSCQAAAAQESPVQDEATVESYKKAIAEAQTDTEKAVLYKKLGDLFAAREDFTNAAEQYIQALSLKRDFPTSDRLSMAVAISWGDRLDEALAEFRAIVQEEPDNLPARIHLARTLAWAGKFDESLIEINIVLQKDPRDKDALLIKANDLRWKGEFDGAYDLYRSILHTQEDFDARLGYTYVLIARGEDAAARESLALLKPAYPYQERELKKLLKEFKPSTESRGDLKFSRYDDTDGNIVYRYAASYGLHAKRWNALLNYLQTEAHDDTRRDSSSLLTGEARTQLTRQVGITGGLGVIQYHTGEVSNFVTGHVKADAEFPGIAVGVAMTHAPLQDTAELIENRIRFTSAGTYLSGTVTERVSVQGSYTYADYTDGNNSDDLGLTLRATLLPGNPRIVSGYRFRLLNFNRQSFAGYFDPNNFQSHQIFLNTSFERDGFSGFVELFVGQQSYRRYGVGHDDTISGGSLSIAYKLTSAVSAELSAEGGNYALQTASGFRYHLYGFRLIGTW